ncbi:MAG TPA: FAD binding domain-containing protein, partial [Chthoniobacteraceae bacterium]|nr:FAD binding domain-containing protein [Chthoniobacteraceae bacterium]
SLFEGYYRDDLREHWQVADQLCGNLCRCTGYRPIRDAALHAFAQRTGEDRFSARLQQPSVSVAALRLENGAEAFLRPNSFPELFALKRQYPTAPYVAGATEIGVLINKRYLRFPQLISLDGIEELRRIETTPEAWHIGGAATLTAIEEVLRDELPAFGKMLRLFASRQIRSRATLGGNLATASPIGDSAPVLLALDASVVLVSENGERAIPLSKFFVGYRKTVLLPNELIKTVIIPQRAGARTEFFKVSKRREMDISTVSVAFCVERDASGIVTLARLAFGGVAVTPSRATSAEQALVGRTIAESREAVSEALRSVFTPIDDVRGSAAYRQGLVVSLWEKFADGAGDPVPDFTPAPATTATGNQLCRGSRLLPLQDGATGESGESRRLPHESGAGHVTGRAEYVDDVGQCRRMLEIWPVCSPHAHAKILRRDATKARAFPGIRAVLLAEDVPGHNNVGVSRKDEILLADVEVLYHGHIVAIVVGESAAACREAAALVEVDYEPLPAITTLREAIAAESFHTDANFMRRGDWRSALDASAHTFSGEFELGGQEHFYLETHAAWAQFDGDGNLLVSSSTQHPSEIQTIVAEVLHMPRSRIVVQVPRMGGGFGGKETQGNTWAALVSLAALKTGSAVRVQLDRDLDMQLTGKRHPFYSRFQVGFDDEGRLQTLCCELFSNGGWSL